MSSEMFIKRDLPVLLGALCSLMMFLGYFTSIPIFMSADSIIRGWAPMISAISLVLGSVILVRHIINRMIKEKTTLGYVFGVYPLLLIALFIVVGLGFGAKSDVFKSLNMNVYQPGGSLMSAMQAFFWIEGAYIGFRVRTKESLIMFLAVMITLFGVAPFGEAIWGPIAPINSWILNNPVMAGSRAILITTALGSTLIFLRMMMGREKTMKA